jgi:predicted negative regulator of RcsB-dependent stress response
MAYDLEEQENIAELKAWWRQYGGIVVSVIAAAAIAAAAWQGWRWYQASSATQASTLYDSLSKAAQIGDAKAMRDSGGALVESYPRTLYASMGALTLARFYFERNDPKSAQAQLQWVIDRSVTPEFRDLARLRLAALLLDQKAYDEALKQLGEKHAESFDAQFEALKGDVLVASGKPADAKGAYKTALDKAGKGDTALRDSVRIRLDALGG